MKKHLPLLFLFVIIFSATTQAKIWRVNNITGVTADFTSLGAAVSSASVLAGDTIHMEGSPSNYGSATLTKRLVIMGTGYYLSETSPMVANPKTEANINPSSISNIYLNPGSKGSVISGLYIYGAVVLQDSLVTIQRNLIANSFYFGDDYSGASAYADTIRQNVIGGYLTCGYASTGIFKNILIYNNILFSSNPVSFSNNINNLNGFFINNDFLYIYSQYNGNYINLTSANFVYQNNILGYCNFGAYQSSNVYFNNVCNGTGVPAGNANVQNADVTNAVFLDWGGNGAGYSSDGRYKLKPSGNPAAGAGSLNGGPVDCGAFGGPAPYILSGMPNAPSIYALTVPTQVNTGTATMNITLSSASH